MFATSLILLLTVVFPVAAQQEPQAGQQFALPPGTEYGHDSTAEPPPSTGPSTNSAVSFGFAGTVRSLWRTFKPDWRLADRTYYEPLLAEQRAARIFLLFPGWSKEFPHSEKPSERFAWQVTLGREIPIVGWETRSAPFGSLFTAGQWGLGVWVPISFHVIEDFKDESNPIVDTDYRFGVMLKSQIGLPKQSRLSIRFVPWAHESTHLGDEYTLVASKRPDFERINVSHEYWEYGISYERSLRSRSSLKLRHGGIVLWGSDGYYSDHLLGSLERTLRAPLRYLGDQGARRHIPIPPCDRIAIVCAKGHSEPSL